MEWKESNEINAPTKIYLPERIYGMEAKFKLDDDNTYSFDEETQELSIEPAPGISGVRVIRITP